MIEAGQRAFEAYVRLLQPDYPDAWDGLSDDEQECWRAIAHDGAENHKHIIASQARDLIAICEAIEHMSAGDAIDRITTIATRSFHTADIDCPVCGEHHSAEFKTLGDGSALAHCANTGRLIRAKVSEE